MIPIRLNLFNLKKQLEVRDGRDYTLVEIAEGAGVSYYGLMRAVNGDTSGVQFDTLGKLLAYFRGKGLEVTTGDMFVEEDAGKLTPAHPALAGA